MKKDIQKSLTTQVVLKCQVTVTIRGLEFKRVRVNHRVESLKDRKFSCREFTQIPGDRDRQCEQR
jgi:hypothetical protein